MVKGTECTVCQSCSVLRSLIIMNIVGSLTVSLAMQTGAGRRKGGRRRLTGLNLAAGSSSFTGLLCVVISAYLKWIWKLLYIQLELSMNLREISQCPEKAPTSRRLLELSQLGIY